MEESRVLIELVVVLGTAALVTILFQAIRLPVVLGYVLAGLLIGPHLPVPLVANAKLVAVLSELGVILLMFTIGLELRLSTLARVGAPAALTAVVEVGFTIAAGALVARLLGFDATTAVFAGACLGISSTMLVAKAFEDLGWKGGFTEIVFAILVFEDVIAIVLLALLAGVSAGAQLDGVDVVITLGKLAGFLAAMLAAGLLVMPRAFRWIARRARPETLAIAALALCFGMAAVAAAADYSVALGAFLAGVLIAESGRGHDVFELVRPLRDVFAMVFFVSVGMTIDPAQLAAEAPRIAVLAAVVLIAKPIGVGVGVLLAGNGVTPGIRAGLTLAQVGELSFVIAAIAPSRGVDLLAVAVGISCITTLSSPVLVRTSERVATWLVARLPQRLATFIGFYEAWLSRLRKRDRGLWRELRRPIVVLVLDGGVVVAIVIAAAALGPRLVAQLPLDRWAGGALVVGAAGALSTPFVIGLTRRIARIAGQLAAEVIPPATADVDLGRAPRRLLTKTFELAIALVTVIPMVVAIQPFVPASPVIVVVVTLALLGVLRRSLADFEGHVRAGSELILELLASPAPEQLPHALETMLPGFEGLTSVAIEPGQHAVGRSLAQLDLRARTGAMVLAIARGDRGVATPSPTEPLQAGDVLALAGPDTAVASARDVLARGAEPTSPHPGP